MADLSLHVRHLKEVLDVGNGMKLARVTLSQGNVVSGHGPSYDTAVTNDTFCDDYCVTDLCDKFTQYPFCLTIIDSNGRERQD